MCVDVFFIKQYIKRIGKCWFDFLETEEAQSKVQVVLITFAFAAHIGTHTAAS